MRRADARNRSAGEAAHLVLFDGVCILCSTLLRFVAHRDRGRRFAFATLQSATARRLVQRAGGNPDALTSFYVLADYQTPAGRALTRSEAVLFVARELGWPWKAALAARALPKKLRDRAYDVVARYRYRVFGRRTHCLLPDPDLRNRLIE